MKFMKRRVINSLGSFSCREFEFDVELLWKIKKTGFRIKEIYVPTRDMKADKFSVKDAVRMFINIIKLRLR